MLVAEYIFDCLAKYGIRHVFLLPGGSAMHLNDALLRNSRLQHTCMLHEQAVAIATEAASRVDGIPAAALVSVGPGSTNALTGVVAAWLDSTPCVFLSGQVKRADLRNSNVRQLGAQEVDVVSIVRPVTKYATVLIDPQMVPYQLNEALHIATTGRPGPVWLDVPLDVQSSRIDPTRCVEFNASPGSHQTYVEAAARVLSSIRSSERPVLLLGNGARSALSGPRGKQFIETLNVPVLTTWLGQDFVDDQHPLFMGRPGPIAPRYSNFILQNTDCLLSIGARLDMAMLAFQPLNVARAARRIVVDIDKAELEKFPGLVHDMVECDAKDFFDAILGQCEGSLMTRSAWTERCRHWKQKYPFLQPKHLAVDASVNTYSFTDSLSRMSASSDILVFTSAGVSIGVLFAGFRAKQGQRIFHNRGTGGMGLALPAAIGAAAATGRRTICVDGDGSFLMNVQELATAVGLGLNLKIFVLNNGGYASIRNSQMRHFGRCIGADAQSGTYMPDLRKLAEAFGAFSCRVERNESLDQQVQAVLERPGVVVCDVQIPRDEVYEPVVASKKNADGSMVTSPLEDMSPLLERAEFESEMLIPSIGRQA